MLKPLSYGAGLWCATVMRWRAVRAPRPYRTAGFRFGAKLECMRNPVSNSVTNGQTLARGLWALSKFGAHARGIVRPQHPKRGLQSAALVALKVQGVGMQMRMCWGERFWVVVKKNQNILASWSRIFWQPKCFAVRAKRNLEAKLLPKLLPRQISSKLFRRKSEKRWQNSVP